jgi:hypothetical protein
MDHEPLRRWLDLAETPWPPNYYELLSLEPQDASTDEIEQRVMERMDRLRQHQLRHPELVTEGMNLLAQAMITLSDPVARSHYDRSLRPDSPSEPELLEIADESLPEVYSLAEEEPPPLPLPLPIPIAIPPPGPKTKSLSQPPLEPRRALYRDLARLRRVIRPWARLRGHLEIPESAFARRWEIIEFMANLSELRPLLPSVSDHVGGARQPGHLIATMARQALAVDVFRSLLPSQREALSRDCRLGFLKLREAYHHQRQAVRRLNAKTLGRQLGWRIYREIYARPEWVMLAIGLLALLIAFIRGAPL